MGYACGAVGAELRKLGVPAARAAIGSAGSAAQTLRVVVAPWSAMPADPGVQSIERGPRASGVYARFSTDGRTLSLLDQGGRIVRTMGPGAGLLAATRTGENAPLWVVTGTDSAGAAFAARAFNQSTLQNRFAVAVSAAGAQAVPAAGE
jgi:hypothetical protein